MPNYNIYFHATLLFPKSRISNKTGNVNISSDEIINNLNHAKCDIELYEYICECLEKRIKTCKVISLDLTSITLTK